MTITSNATRRKIDPLHCDAGPAEGVAIRPESGYKGSPVAWLGIEVVSPYEEVRNRSNPPQIYQLEVEYGRRFDSHESLDLLGRREGGTKGKLRTLTVNDEDARTLPKIELFCRGAPRPGWAAWGNEAVGEQLLGSAEGGRKR